MYKQKRTNYPLRHVNTKRDEREEKLSMSFKVVKSFTWRWCHL